MYRIKRSFLCPVWLVGVRYVIDQQLKNWIYVLYYLVCKQKQHQCIGISPNIIMIVAPIWKDSALEGVGTVLFGSGKSVLSRPRKVKNVDTWKIYVRVANIEQKASTLVINEREKHLKLAQHCTKQINVDLYKLPIFILYPEKHTIGD